jgi:hypothetical protein
MPATLEDLLDSLAELHELGLELDRRERLWEAQHLHWGEIQYPPYAGYDTAADMFRVTLLGDSACAIESPRALGRTTFLDKLDRFCGSGLCGGDHPAGTGHGDIDDAGLKAAVGE